MKVYVNNAAIIYVIHYFEVNGKVFRYQWKHFLENNYNLRNLFVLKRNHVSYFVFMKGQ